MAEQHTTPEQRQALRARYTPEPVPTCPHCGKPMGGYNGGPEGVVREWLCDNGHADRYTETSVHLVPHDGDPDVLAAVDDADALAGALADAARLRDAASMVLVNASLPDSCNYCIVDNGEDGLDALRAALGQSGDQEADDAGAEVARLRARIQDALDTSWGDRGGERSASDALDDVRTVLNAALTPQSGAEQNVPARAPRMPHSAPDGETARNGAEGPVAGATSEIREDAANGRTR